MWSKYVGLIQFTVAAAAAQHGQAHSVNHDQRQETLTFNASLITVLIYLADIMGLKARG